MDHKINFFLNALLVLLFGMVLNTYSLASEPDYTDFEIPVEFFEELIDYYNSTIVNYSNSYMLINNSAEDLKTFYDNNLKSLLISNSNKGYNDQNLICYFRPIDTSSLRIYIAINNNTIGSAYNALNYEISNNTYKATNSSASFTGVRIILSSDGNITGGQNYDSNYIGTWRYNVNQVNSENVTLQNVPFFGMNAKALNVVNLSISGFDDNNWFLENYYNINPLPEVPDEPEQPSGDTGETGTTGTITNPSGDTTGKVDLSGIEEGIGNINHNIDKTNEKLDGISGEIGNLNNSVNDLNNNLTNVPNLSGENLTSGEIIGALNFDFMEDPYANFWLELTTGLGGALTNNIRTLDINWLGYVHTINLDTIGLKYPPSMEFILKSTSTISIVWILVKWWKIIIDKLSSGNMDEVLAMNEEERYC